VVVGAHPGSGLRAVVNTPRQAVIKKNGHIKWYVPISTNGPLNSSTSFHQTTIFLAYQSTYFLFTVIIVSSYYSILIKAKLISIIGFLQYYKLDYFKSNVF